MEYKIENEKYILLEPVTEIDIMKADDDLENSVRFMFDDEPWTFSDKGNKRVGTIKAAFRQIDEMTELLKEISDSQKANFAKVLLHDALRVHKIEILSLDSVVAFEKRCNDETNLYYKKFANRVQKAIEQTFLYLNSL